MLVIRKDYEVAARNATNEMLQDLSDMAKVVLGDYLSFDDVCDDMGCEDEELEAILNGTLGDLNLSEYNYIKCYFEGVIKTYSDKSEGEDTGISVDGANDNKNSCNGECKTYQGEDCSIHTYSPDDTTVEIAFNKDNSELTDFIKKVNKNLPDDSKINIEEAVKAQEVFKDDLQNIVKRNYDNIAKESNMELFGTTEDISKMGMESLKYLLKKNELYNTIPSELKNHRQTVLSALYHKLEEKIAEKTLKKYNIGKKDIDFNKRVVKLSKEFSNPNEILKKIQDILKD